MAKSSHARSLARRQKDRSLGDARVSSPERIGWAPPAGVPTMAGAPAPEAIGVFGRAMTAFQRRDYRAALTQFDQLRDRYPAEGALLDRACVYAARCRRELAPPADAIAQPIDQRLTAATAALNNGDDGSAARLVTSVLDDAPEHDHAHYLLAVVHARRGAVPEAVAALRHAIGTSPEVRLQARCDSDFEPLRGDEGFEGLVAEPPAHSDTSNGS
jgi:hypothetical protein